MANKRFVISDERVVNCYGVRVMTAGIDIAQYERNPVMLYMHERDGKQVCAVIGNFINLRKEGPVLTGEPLFDEEDEFALLIKGKVDRGFLRACSPLLEVKECSDAPDLLLEGQMLPTATKTKLKEISICDIPGNDGALRLRLADGLWLPEEPTAIAEKLALQFTNLKPQQAPKMQQILSTLKLAAGTSEMDVVAAINKIQNDANANTAKIVTDLALKANLVTPDKKDSFLRLASLDPTAALDLLDMSKVASAANGQATPPKDQLRLTDVVQQVEEQNKPVDPNAAQSPLDKLLTLRADWDARKWEREDPTNWLKLKHEKPDAHAQIYKNYYDLKG
ncbi:hypothetical protein [Hymenobacter glacieicola]|uniref:Peptidase n=1 Tax=Hymenobacter glacieicola TaxID=1562124 RepID=A0ABQ1WJD1_9BACT|nr:hypothetical protein [Hymenobacter glacieicola]GGG33345.1 hypothetical protein GCM10011378_07260 [Hymenobacter glacieicola]